MPRAAEAPSPAAPLGIVTAGGALAGAIADTLAARGRSAFIVAIGGEAAALRRHAGTDLPWGKVGAIVARLRKAGCAELVFLGGTTRPKLGEFRFDLGTLAIVPRIVAALRRGDDGALRMVAAFFEEQGFKVRGIGDFVPELLAPAGLIAGRPPDAAARADAALGAAYLAATSPFDTGQAVIVVDGRIVAVEAAEGTDAMLARIPALRAARRLRAGPGRGVLVKRPKAGQDLRLDLPTIGPETVRGIAEAGLAGLAVAAGATLVVDLGAVVRQVAARGLFLVGLEGEAAP